MSTQKVLFIGVDALAKAIASRSGKGITMMGFDIATDKVADFQQVISMPADPIKDLIAVANIVILNTPDLIRRKDVFRSLLGAADNIIVIDTNGYKGNELLIRQHLEYKERRFVPCNFTMFPSNVIINTSDNTSLGVLRGAYSFIEGLQTHIITMDEKTNDTVFSNLYYAPFILQKTLFKRSNLHFVQVEASREDILLNDIVLGREKITDILHKISVIISAMDSREKLLSLIKGNSLGVLPKNSLITEMPPSHLHKILIEKILIKLAKEGGYEGHFNTIKLNLDHKIYSEATILERVASIEDISSMITLLREQIRNVASILNFSDFTVGRLREHLIE